MILLVGNLHKFGDSLELGGQSILVNQHPYVCPAPVNPLGDFVGSDRAPQPMEPHEVDSILKGMKETEEKPQLKIEYNVGDRVKIRDGPFANFNGIVDEVNSTKGMVRVIVTIFGRETPVDMEYWQVEPV